MRRILLLSPLALLSACVVRAYDTRPAPVVYDEPPPVAAEPTYYQYNGPHPLPDSEGGGWCPVEGVHTHPFAPDNSYQFVQQTYVYAGPRVIWYNGFHPVPGGGYCYLEGRHSHGYLPPAEVQTSFVWTPGPRYYTYRGSYVPPGVHTAVGYPGYGRPPTYAPPPVYHPVGSVPPPGHVGGYVPPPNTYPPPGSPPPYRPPPPGNPPPYTPPPNNPPPYTPPPQGNPPPGHGGQIPGHGGFPPGHNPGGVPPGQQNNPGHGGYDPGPNPPGHGNGGGNGNGHRVVYPAKKVPPGQEKRNERF